MLATKRFQATAHNVMRLEKLQTEQRSCSCSSTSTISPSIIINNPNNDIYIQLAENVTALVGLKEAVTTKEKPLRYFWIVLLVAGIAATGFYLYKTAEEYWSGDRVTKISVEKNLSFEYPRIVFCPPYWVDTEKVDGANLSHDATRYSLGYFDDDSKMGVINLAEARREFSDFYQRQNFPSLHEYYKEIATDLERTSESRFWNTTEPAYFCRGCQRAEVEKEVFDDRVCYGFNDLRSDQGTRRSLINYRFQMKTKEKSKPIHESKYGTWMVLFSQNDATEKKISSVLFFESYRIYFLKIRLRKYLTMSHPNSPCLPIEHKSTNSTAKCIRRCESELFKRYFGCDFWIYPSPDLSQFCNRFDPFRNYSTYDEYSKSDEAIEIRERVVSDCFERCPLMCERTIYDIVTVSHTSWESHYAENVLRVSKENNLTMATVYILRSYLGEAMVIYEEIDTYSVIKLVNNVGGTLGLFIGGTLMTLIQIVVVLLAYLCRKLRKQ